jgi:predicted Zn finger-like uncharacterized protein
MILTCPQCETRYQADAAKFAPPGRKVRCAKCGHLWHQDAPEPEEGGLRPFTTPEPEPAPAPEPVSAPVTEPEPQRAAYVPAEAPVAEPVAQNRTTVTAKKPVARSRMPMRIGLIAGWLGLVVVILVIGWSTLTYRQQIATVWPQAASVYAALGLHVNTRGLDFVDVAYHRETEDGQQVLAVSGKLVNISAHELSVPPIEVTLTDDSKRMLYHWSFSSSTPTLRPGQTVAFLTRLSSPPSGARHLELRFAAAGG